MCFVFIPRCACLILNLKLSKISAFEVSSVSATTLHSILSILFVVEHFSSVNRWARLMAFRSWIDLIFKTDTCCGKGDFCFAFEIKKTSEFAYGMGFSRFISIGSTASDTTHLIPSNENSTISLSIHYLFMRHLNWKINYSRCIDRWLREIGRTLKKKCNSIDFGSLSNRMSNSIV